MFFGLQFVFFSQIFQWTDDLGGWSEQKVKILFVIASIIQIAASAFLSSIHTFFLKVTRGQMEPFLVKPYSLMHLVFLRWSKPSHVILAFLLSFYTFFFFWHEISRISFTQGVVFALVVAYGIVCQICFATLLNLATFVIHRQLPVDYIHSEVNRLCFVPPNLLSNKTFNFILVSIPMIFAGGLATTAIFDQVSSSHYGFITISTFFVILTKYGLSWGIKKFEGIGG